MKSAQSREPLNFKQAIMTKTDVQKTEVDQSNNVMSDNEQKEKERIESFHIWMKTVDALCNKWDKYKKNYIEMYGEDEYDKRYTTPNYWVCPDIENEEEESENSDSGTESYDSYSEYDYK
jgi:hypothetical protein